MTMKAAQEMGRKRWEGKSQEERADHAQMLAEARRTISPERRKEIAKKAAAARWGPKKAAPKKAGVKKKATKKKKEDL